MWPISLELANFLPPKISKQTSEASLCGLQFKKKW